MTALSDPKRQASHQLGHHFKEPKYCAFFLRIENTLSTVARKIGSQGSEEREDSKDR